MFLGYLAANVYAILTYDYDVAATSQRADEDLDVVGFITFFSSMLARQMIYERRQSFAAIRNHYAASRYVRALPTLPAGDRRLTDDCCPVCGMDLDPDSARLTPCGHTFHGKCLELCLRFYEVCPMCRRQLLHRPL